ncbi:hypothetical protein F0L68_01060 [Solihabitans fulvus]|uniref:Asparagine synthetase domain-containing protein n=1 Tax=Solihabitans fulvus TaxID=1892852 RepID=A0A5B2XVX2_9PSEU|nr:asparagine synthase-related protein [Solihabitans fulvus]KAA2267150.1 hypothetical protein F0L68_01060 [Solihabitans fulvus]
MPEVSTSWFVVLPDQDLPPELLARLRRHAPQRVPHPSGRPWLLGRWSPDQVALARVGDVRLAVAGPSSLSAPDLAARLRGTPTPTAVEEAVRGAHGSFHVFASLGDRGYARGTAFGTRRLYRAAVDGVTVCADRARILAWLIGAEVDTGQLAARLCVPPAPHPVAGGAMWRGVHAVPPGQALLLERDGRHRTLTWWRPPDNTTPLDKGALALRTALRDAVALRVRPGEVLAADLSGGMDSTSVCFLAAEAGARLITATLHWTAPGNQDRDYARHAAELLPDAQSLVFPSTDLPACFTGLNERQEPADEPSLALRDQAQQASIAAALRARGAVRRVGGHGGDHAVQPPNGVVHGLLRRQPVTALRHAAGWRARERWPLTATARALLDGRSYGRWLDGLSRQLYAPTDPRSVPHAWGAVTRLPSWASEQAGVLVADLLRAAARDGRPLSGDHAQHRWIGQAQEAGWVATRIEHSTTLLGLPTDSPFCDDAVITACLAVRPHEALDPWTYKPLLAAAMDGVVPERVLRRVTKDHCGEEWHRGVKQHRRDLAAWAEDSHLAGAGVVDSNRLRSAFLSPGLLARNEAELEYTIGAEAWLRDVAAHPVPAGLEPTDPEESSHATAAR